MNSSPYQRIQKIHKSSIPAHLKTSILELKIAHWFTVQVKAKNIWSEINLPLKSIAKYCPSNIHKLLNPETKTQSYS